jgi:hypothetical protein
MNINWPRWSYASITKHFATEISSIPIFIEGADRETDELADFVEIRVDGPWMNEISADYWRIYCEINILVQSVMDDDLHKLWRLIGEVNVAFQKCLSVYKYGTGNDDDSSFLGCFKFVTDKYDREQVKTSNFGQINLNVKLQQATVEAHYEMFLSL